MSNSIAFQDIAIAMHGLRLRKYIYDCSKKIFAEQYNYNNKIMQERRALTFGCRHRHSLAQ